MSLFSGRIKTRKIAFFCREMAYSYDAGIPLLKGLELIAESTHNRRLRRVLRHVQAEIRNGASLSEAVAAQQQYWPDLFIHTLRAGEAAGRIKRVLYQLADHYEQCMSFRRALMKELLYPICLLVAAIIIGIWQAAMISMLGTTGGKMNFRVFAEAFARMSIPQIAGMVMPIAVLLLLWRLGVWQWIWMQVKTFVWPLSIMTRKLAIVRFNRALGLLLDSGLGAAHAIEYAAHSADNPHIAKRLLESLPRLELGATLTEAIAPCPYVSETECQMLHIGEVSGTLGKSLTKSAELIELETCYTLKMAIRMAGLVFFFLVVCILFGGLIF